MYEMVYSNKNCMNSYGITDANYNFNMEKPMLCPYCNAFEDGTTVDRKLFSKDSKSRFGVMAYQCTHCNKNYLVVYSIDIEKKLTKVEAICPSVSLKYANDLIEQMSPRFIDMYNQALKAETDGNMELAAIGFRASLEILVKDYAVVELNEDKSIAAKKDLFDSIGTYLGNQELVASGDVVRILGNDYAHYERKYPEQDFSILKSYMEIFIHLVETKLMLAHPPVARQPKNLPQPALSPQGSNTP